MLFPQKIVISAKAGTQRASVRERYRLVATESAAQRFIQRADAR
jgi:hypothetical protein